MKVVRFCILLAFAAVFVAQPACAQAEPPSPAGDLSVPPPPPVAQPRARPGEPFGKHMSAMAAQFDKELDRDIQWLREQGLDEYAKRMEELRRSNSPADHLLLWRIHRRLDQRRRLPPETLKQAVEEIRLEFRITALAAQYRGATPDLQPALLERIRVDVTRQFDLRLDVQRVIIANIKRRLDQIRQGLQRQKEIREELIDRRVRTLTDPAIPLPEPAISGWPELQGPGKPEGSPEPPPPPDGPPPDRALKLHAPDDAPPPPPEPRQGEGRRSGSRRGWNIQIDSAINDDVAWLRAHDLGEFADRIVEIRDSADSPGRRMLLWRIHRRVDQLRDLKPQDARRAIEDIRLEFAAVRLAREWREAQEDARDALAEELHKILQRQFGARLESQQAIIQGIVQRLDATEAKLDEQRRFRDDLINRRVDQFADPTQPRPEPQLVSPPDDEG